MHQFEWRDSPLLTNPQEMVLVGSGTVADMVRQAFGTTAIGMHVDVSIGHYSVPVQLWDKVTPKPMTVIRATAIPAGGGSGRKIIRSVAQIAIAVGAMIINVVMGPVVAAGYTLVANLLLNAVLPPPKPKLTGAAEREPPLNFLTGSSNQFMPWGVVPYVVGEARWFPPLACQPLDEAFGQTQRMTYMFECGDGDMEHLEPKIGDTLLNTTNFKDWEMEYLAPGQESQLYRADVNTVNISATLDDGAEVIRSFAPYVDEGKFDIAFPQGLFGLDDKGKQVNVTADFDVEYREIGAASWTPVSETAQHGTQTVRHGFAAGWTVKTTDKKPFVVTASFGLDKTKAFELRVKRNTTSWGSVPVDNRAGAAQWTVLRSMKPGQPASTDTNRIVLRIKSTDQINGQLNNFSVFTRQKYLNPANGLDWNFTCNPAHIIYTLMTDCGSTAVLAPRARMDTTAWYYFGQFCATNGFELRGVVDSSTLFVELIDDFLSNSMGSRTMRNGLYGVIWDSGNQPVEATITPYETSGFTVSKAFPKLPHAIRAKFRNMYANWQDDEIIVPFDGYSWRGKDAHGNASLAPAATEFEEVDFRWAKKPAHVWRLARMHQAQALFRGVKYEWGMDVLNLLIKKGHVIRVGHDVPKWGHVVGKIEQSEPGKMWLTEIGEYDLTKTYKARIITATGYEIFTDVIPDAEETHLLNISGTPAIGSTVIVGETDTVERKLMVTGVIPGQDLTAQITAVDFSSAVYPYWQNPPSTFVSELSGNVFGAAPPPPNLDIIVSDPKNGVTDDAGITEPEVHVAVVKQENTYLNLRHIRQIL